jgi:hypothetical protein
MKVKIYTWFGVGGPAGDTSVVPSYRDIVSANRSIEEFFINDGFSLIDGSYDTIPSKGIPLKMYQTFLKENALAETGVRTDRNNSNRAILSLAVATTPHRYMGLVERLFPIITIPLQPCSRPEVWPRASLDLFRDIYQSLVLESLNFDRSVGPNPVREKQQPQYQLG